MFLAVPRFVSFANQFICHWNTVRFWASHRTPGPQHHMRGMETWETKQNVKNVTRASTGWNGWVVNGWTIPFTITYAMQTVVSILSMKEETPLHKNLKMIFKKKRVTFWFCSINFLSCIDYDFQNNVVSTKMIKAGQNVYLCVSLCVFAFWQVQLAVNVKANRCGWLSTTDITHRQAVSHQLVVTTQNTQR